MLIPKHWLMVRVGLPTRLPALVPVVVSCTSFHIRICSPARRLRARQKSKYLPVPTVITLKSNRKDHLPQSLPAQREVGQFGGSYVRCPAGRRCPLEVPRLRRSRCCSEISESGMVPRGLRCIFGIRRGHCLRPCVSVGNGRLDIAPRAAY